MCEHYQKRIFGILFAAMIASLAHDCVAAFEPSSSPDSLIKLDPHLETVIENLQPNEWILAWVDVEACVSGLGGRYLPGDPALYGINWIMITSDPDIEQNDTFWVLAEVKVRDIERISRIPWVKNICLIRSRHYERVSSNPKFAVKGLDLALERALKENKSLELVITLENKTAPERHRYSKEKNDSLADKQKEAMIENVTAHINSINGKIQRIGTHRDKIVARIPPQNIKKLTSHSFVSEIYNSGPIVFLGSTSQQPHLSQPLLKDRLLGTLANFSCFEIILGMSILTFDRKNRKKTRLLTLVILAIAPMLSLSMQPSAYALDVSTSAIRANEVWTQLNINGSGITVAVIDSGIDYNHPDFGGAIVHAFTYGAPTEPPMDDSGHGTHVAGIIAGRGLNNSAFKGVAFGASLLVIRLQPHRPEDLNDAIDWVRQHKGDYTPPIKVLSLSVAAPGEPTGEAGTSIYSKAVDDAVEAGIIVVGAAGNKGLLGSKSIGTPSDAFNIITVGAIHDSDTSAISDDLLWEYSSRGPTGDEGGGRPKPDVVAPGVHITSCRRYPKDIRKIDLGDSYIDRYYIDCTGTSMAAPHVAGTVALMLQANPNLTPAQAKAILRQTAKLNSNLNSLTANDRGYGIIDAFAAVQLAPHVDAIAERGIWDAWFVETPGRMLTPLWESWDYLGFAVSYSSLYGIVVENVHYHFEDNFGQTSSEYGLLWHIGAWHVWINNTYYDLGSDIGKYLYSGPRIYYKDGGVVLMRAYYKVGNVLIEYLWKMDVDEMWLKLTYIGGSSSRTLFYIDPNVGGSANYAYLPSTKETLLVERKIWNPINVDIRNYAQEDYVQIEPNSTDIPTMWILKGSYLGNNPNSALTGQCINNTNIVVYYEAVSSYPDPGPVLRRKHNPPPVLNTTQNDANTGGDAGNTYENATLITPNDAYSGILCSHNSVDTDDWYQFYVDANQTIEVTMNTGTMNELDFDLELYSPNDANNSKASSHLPAGFSESISYVADCSGYWRLRNYIISDEGQYTIYLIVHSSGGPPEPPPGDPPPEMIENPDL